MGQRKSAFGPTLASIPAKDGCAMRVDRPLLKGLIIPASTFSVCTTDSQTAKNNFEELLGKMESA